MSEYRDTPEEFDEQYWELVDSLNEPVPNTLVYLALLSFIAVCWTGVIFMIWTALR